MKKLIFILFFLNACSSPSEISKSDQIIVEENPGSTNYSISYDDLGYWNELSGCELICIGERNFANSVVSYPKKEKQLLYEKLLNKNKSVSTYVNICERESKGNDSKNQFICAQKPSYPQAGIQVCNIYNKSQSENSEIKRIVNMCNESAENYFRDHYEKRAREQKKFQEDYTNKLISYCDKIGFKTGTESNGNCVLRILDTQRQLNEEKVTSSSTKIIVEKENSLINSLILMQMGLNLMNPPQPKLNCTTNLFGWTCY